MAKDMTSGRPIKLLLMFALPMLVGNIFQLFYAMVDTIVVGRFVGPQALAAVGSTGSLSFLVIGFAIGLMAGFSILVSQEYGAMQNGAHMDYNGIRHIVAMSFLLTAVITILITGIMVFATRPLLILMDTPEDILEDAFTYIFIVFMGMVATLIYNLAAAIMRAIGDSKAPLWMLVLCSLINVALDLVFVVGFHWDIVGVAVATVIAQCVSALVSVTYLFVRYPFLRPEAKHWKIDMKLCGRLLAIGVPNAFMNSITAVGCMVSQAVVNSFGSTAVAAFTAAARVEEIATQPAATLGAAMATYVGQNCGAKRLDRVKAGVHKGAILTFAINILAGVVVLIFGRQLTALFVTTDDVAVMAQLLDYASQYQFTVAVAFWALGLLFVYRNALQGMGNPIIPFWSGVIELFARVIISIWWAQLFGYFGMCWANAVAWLTAGALLSWGFYHHFKKMAKADPEMITGSEKA